MRDQLEAAYAIFRRDLDIFLSYRGQAVSHLFSAAFSIALFYYISRLLQIREFESPDAYFAFVVVGLVIMAVLQSTLVLAASVRSELVAGTFERLLLSPFGAVRGALSMMIFPMVLAIALGVWTLLLATVFFGLGLRWETAGLALPLALLTALAFSAIALLATAAVIVFKQAPGVGALVALVTLVSGFYFPTALLPGWIGWTADVQPFTPAVGLLRNVLAGLPMSEPAWLAVAKLCAFALIILPLAAWAFARGIALSQRRGTIIEY
jgi:ABC-2 type transport system permease protein